MRLQDLPAEHVTAFLGLGPGYKEHMAVKLFSLAAGEPGAEAVRGLTFGELEHLMTEWLIASAESEETDKDGTGLGLDLDWSELLR